MTATARGVGAELAEAKTGLYQSEARPATVYRDYATSRDGIRRRSCMRSSAGACGIGIGVGRRVAMLEDRATSKAPSLARTADEYAGVSLQQQSYNNPMVRYPLQLSK
jgi:hypothetical protein